MEELAKTMTIYISHVLEIAAAAVIAAALIYLIIGFLQSIARIRNSITALSARVHFGSRVAVSLELLLGADVLATAVAPSWDDIGKLAAIAIIRTALNYFLGKELKEIRTEKGTA